MNLHTFTYNLGAANERASIMLRGLHYAPGYASIVGVGQMADERLGLPATQAHRAQQASESSLGYRLFPPLHSLTSVLCFTTINDGLH